MRRRRKQNRPRTSKQKVQLLRNNPANHFSSSASCWTVAGDRLYKLTEANIGKKLAIVYKGKVLSEPVINAPISTSGNITGNFKKEEAEEIAAVINEAAEITTNKLDQIVHSLNAMTPEAASQVIAAWPESEFNTIIGLVDEEVRKRILQEMDSRKSEPISQKPNENAQDGGEPLSERILYDKNSPTILSPEISTEKRDAQEFPPIKVREESTTP